MSNEKCETDKPTKNLTTYNNTPFVEAVDFLSDPLSLIPEMENREVGDGDINLQNLEDEPTAGTLAILEHIEIIDDYFHSCGRW
ncbi:MAG: hypothetical protein RIM23_22430 [Coleofasciculus sp. G3-WIS-01]|uniref:hypothetical protein n=1 Tax=Coleofasciculus sp. G3-WIS-01 TaxID=3069528 RepID=UPI0032F4AEBB